MQGVLTATPSHPPRNSYLLMPLWTNASYQPPGRGSVWVCRESLIVQVMAIENGGLGGPLRGRDGTPFYIECRIFVGGGAGAARVAE